MTPEELATKFYARRMRPRKSVRCRLVVEPAPGGYEKHTRTHEKHRDLTYNCVRDLEELCRRRLVRWLLSCMMAGPRWDRRKRTEPAALQLELIDHTRVTLTEEDIRIVVECDDPAGAVETLLGERLSWARRLADAIDAGEWDVQVLETGSLILDCCGRRWEYPAKELAAMSPRLWGSTLSVRYDAGDQKPKFWADKEGAIVLGHQAKFVRRGQGEVEVFPQEFWNVQLDEAWRRAVVHAIWVAHKAGIRVNETVARNLTRALALRATAALEQAVRDAGAVGRGEAARWAKLVLEPAA